MRWEIQTVPFIDEDNSLVTSRQQSGKLIRSITQDDSRAILAMVDLIATGTPAPIHDRRYAEHAPRHDALQPHGGET